MNKTIRGWNRPYKPSKLVTIVTLPRKLISFSLLVVHKFMLINKNESSQKEFKVHSIIFSEDAFKLEHDLHIVFDDYRVNKVNKQKEHFRVSLDAVKEEVLKHNPTATFIDNPTVDEYELSKTM